MQLKGVLYISAVIVEIHIDSLLFGITGIRKALKPGLISNKTPGEA